MVQVVKQSFTERVEMYMRGENNLQSMYDTRMMFPLDLERPTVDDIRQEYGFPEKMNNEQLARVLAKHDAWFSPLGCSEVEI